MDFKIRPARPGDETEIAALWRNGWLDAHGALVDAEWLSYRDPKSFQRRTGALIDDAIVAEAAAPSGETEYGAEIVGFSAIQRDEIDQFFVAPKARGTGLAATLLAAAEARLRAGGVGRAWLHCAVGNNRAARFYEKCGWRRAVVEQFRPKEKEQAPPSSTIEVWRYEKNLIP